MILLFVLGSIRHRLSNRVFGPTRRHWNEPTLPPSISPLSSHNTQRPTSSLPSRHKQHQLYGLAVSAKRYVVYTRKKNSIEIIKPNEHGLGMVYVPDKRTRYNPVDCKDQEFHRHRNAHRNRISAHACPRLKNTARFETKTYEFGSSVGRSKTQIEVGSEYAWRSSKIKKAFKLLSASSSLQQERSA